MSSFPNGSNPTVGSSSTNTFNIFGDASSFDVVEKVDAILEVGTQK